MTMLTRFFLLLLIGGSLAGAWALWRLWLGQRARRLALATVPAQVAQALPPGPALLYFTTESCAQCRFQQAPILAELIDSGAPPVHKLDALEHQSLAQHFGVMTVPTTVVLDAAQRPIAVNHGLATLSTLHAQLAALDA